LHPLVSIAFPRRPDEIMKLACDGNGAVSRESAKMATSAGRAGRRSESVGCAGSVFPSRFRICSLAEGIV
jgi:hypothetical protein